MENQKDKTVIWQSVLDIIEQNTTQISFETWFKPVFRRSTRKLPTFTFFSSADVAYYMTCYP